MVQPLRDHQLGKRAPEWSEKSQERQGAMQPLSSLLRSRFMGCHATIRQRNGCSHSNNIPFPIFANHTLASIFKKPCAPNSPTETCPIRNRYLSCALKQRKTYIKWHIKKLTLEKHKLRIWFSLTHTLKEREKHMIHCLWIYCCWIYFWLCTAYCAANKNIRLRHSHPHTLK